MAEGYVYIIRTREFASQNESTYKIEKTTQSPNSRMQGYPNGSEIYQFTYVPDCHAVEKRIIQAFHTFFVHRKKFENETFTGDLDVMIDIFNREISTYKLERKTEVINEIIKANIMEKELRQKITKNSVPDLLQGTPMINLTDDIEHDRDFTEDIIDVNISNGKNSSDGFIEFLCKTPPAWYVIGKIVEYDELYDEYITFGSLTKKAFTIKYFDLLFTKSKRISKNGKFIQLVKLLNVNV